MIGATLAHYRITAALGAGGMGEVYRATDTKLGREVALKVLPEEFIDDPQRLDRFEREARAVASLNHPHIVTIHSVEEAEGVRFLTMELIEGRSLDKLIPEGGMELGAFLDLATPLAEAISAAHDKSVIHRDLKPSNVMVDADGRVKVLDFGLAKLQQAGEVSDSTELPTEALTGVGVIVGTVPYMSPEQIEGKIVDYRTDIFSLGVLLYEMATGDRPFQGDSQPALMSSILRDAPPSVVEMRTDLPRHLGRVISRCLEKDRRDRYQTARDVFNELKALQRESSSVGAPGTRPAAAPSRAVSHPSSRSAVSSSGVSADEGFWVAVLPFKYTGGDADLTALAEGLSEDIVTGLSRFSYLRVIARSSTLQYATEAVDVRVVGEKLGARYVMEGSLRRAGKKLRLAVQLVDTDSGAHLWAEAYDRDFDAEDLFALQDELVPRIVSTVADTHGVLPRSMGEALRSRSPEELSPYEAVLRSFSYFERVTAEELAAAREALELAVQKAPDSADAWAMLALLCAQEYGQGFKLLADPLENAANAARRAVETGPSNHLAHFSLAQVLFFRKEFGAFRNAAARAAELNPMDGNSIAFLGELLIYSGDSDRGLELSGSAKRLNPTHPGWYWYADFFHAYRERDYPAALAIAQKVNLPDHWGQHAAIAVACGQLGDREAAGKALKRLLEIRPDFADIARQEFVKWWDPELVEQMLEGLRKAGLEVPQAFESASSSTAAEVSRAPDSGAARTDEGFWVAVLPFKSSGGDADLAALAEGLSEDIVAGLSRFSYLRVVAQSSTLRYADEGANVRVVGEELGARYVMEGSLRQAGKKLRVAVQLVDTVSGAHLWAETYDRAFQPEEVFALQDDLVPRIVSTCADHFGVLARAISEAVRGKPLAEMTPYEALMRGFGYHFRLSPDEHAQAREALERAVEQDPANADCQAMLAWVCAHEVAHGFNPRPGSLDRALGAARMAVDLEPSNHLAQQVLAVVFFFRGETAACRSACERALALNPLDGSNEAIFLTCFTGDWDRGCALIRRAMELNPHHPRWYGAVLALDEYRRGDYRGAVDAAIGANAFDLFWTHWLLAAAHGQLGEMEAARKALDDLFALKPDFAETGGEILSLWFQPELVEHFVDGLREAGLELESGEVAEAEASGGASEKGEGAIPSQPSHPLTDPGERAGQSSAALHEVPAETKSIVVLPFANLSPVPDTEYFSDGLTDEIITDLSRVRALRVISRSSAMRLKGDGRCLEAIGRDLDCRYVLEGSVRRAANSLRITARLVDAPNDDQLWADKYRGTLDDVFDIQERVSRSIVDALEIQLSPDEAAQLAERPIDDVRAQESYLRARNEIWSFMPGSLDLAISHLNAALGLVGDNALIYQGLGEAYFQYVNIGAATGSEEEFLQKAESCADKIFALEPESPRGYLVRAQIRMARGEIHGCGRDLQRVLQVYPKEIMALALYTHLLGWLGGKPDAAAPVAERLIDIDPLNPMSRLVSAMVPLFAGRFAEAVEATRRMYELDPVTPVWRANHVMALGYARRFDEAEALTEAIEAQPDSDIGTWQMGLFRAAWREDRAEVLRLADGPCRQLALWDAEAPWFLALAHAAVGEKDEALLWLDRAIDNGMINYPFLSEHDWYLDSVRGDERFGVAMGRARREWERLDEVLS